MSYYSKPPGIALIQWAGTSLFGDTNFGVRFFSPVFAAILSVLVLRFMAREEGARTAFFLLLITFATPLLVVGSILMTIDPPLVLCWMWAVVAGWRAVQPEGKTRDWLVAGLALGLGFLCKYTAMLQIVCWVIFFALQPSARTHLKKAGPWLALRHFRHLHFACDHLERAARLDHRQSCGGRRRHAQRVASDAELFLRVHRRGSRFAQSDFLHRLVLGDGRGLASPQRKAALVFSALHERAGVLGNWLFSFHSRVQPNWIAAAVPPMFCLMVAFWKESKLRIRPWLAAGLLLGIVASVFMHSSDLIGRLAGRKLPGDKDPTHRIRRGWRETALLVETERAKFDRNAFIIADHYGQTGIYSFYSPPARAAAQTASPLVYCIDADTPANQFFFWDEYNYRAHHRGDNAIFVVRLDPYPLEPGWIGKWLRGEPVSHREIPAPRPVSDRIAAEFETVTNLGVHEIKLSDGRIFQRVEIFGCHHLK